MVHFQNAPNRQEDKESAARAWLRALELTTPLVDNLIRTFPAVLEELAEQFRSGAAHDCSAAAVALAWVIRNGNVIAIPESGVPAHVKENAVALSLTLTPQDLQTLDAAFPGPSGVN